MEVNGHVQNITALTCVKNYAIWCSWTIECSCLAGVRNQERAVDFVASWRYFVL